MSLNSNISYTVVWLPAFSLWLFKCLYIWNSYLSEVLIISTVSLKSKDKPEKKSHTRSMAMDRNRRKWIILSGAEGKGDDSYLFFWALSGIKLRMKIQMLAASNNVLCNASCTGVLWEQSIFWKGLAHWVCVPCVWLLVWREMVISFMELPVVWNGESPAWRLLYLCQSIGPGKQHSMIPSSAEVSSEPC